MRAVVFSEFKTFPTIEEIADPEPGPGEVLLKVAGAGACHSDVAVYAEFEPGMNPLIDPPYTLGHETSGWVEELGEGVSGLEVGCWCWTPTGHHRVALSRRAADVPGAWRLGAASR